MYTLLKNANELPDMTSADLKEGDVLLSRGICATGTRVCISDVIAKLDGGDYSHAAFYDGEHFVQATQSGVAASEPTILPEHQSYMHVYRFHDSDGNPLGSPNLPSAKLVEHAQSLVGTPYGYDDLVLVGILLLLRRYPGNRTISEVLEVLGGIALTKLRKWLRALLGKREQTLVCSELVSEVFWQPSDASGAPYGLPVEITHRHRIKSELPTAQELQDYEALLEEVESAFEEVSPGFSAQLAQHREDENQLMSKQGLSSYILIGGSKRLPSNCVSPCDLQCSPALKVVGNYVQTP